MRAPDHVRYVQSAALDFWNAYLKNDESAADSLKERKLEQTSGSQVEVTVK